MLPRPVEGVPGFLTACVDKDTIGTVLGIVGFLAVEGVGVGEAYVVDEVVLGVCLLLGDIDQDKALWGWLMHD